MKTRNCTFGILGDSYSTFQGYIPEGNRCYYPTKNVDDVLTVEQTWWHQLMKKRKLHLLMDESFSSATVCEHNREDLPEDSSFTKRAIRAFGPENKEKFELLFLFGCTNDSWLDREIGELQYENWRGNDLRKVLPAYCYTIYQLKTHNPEATVVAIINTDLKEKIREGMIQAGEHYGIHNVILSDISKQNGHPDALGMTQIAEQVDAALNLI
ncbi:MAG: hypothetical protein E7435_02575 [Ruminococcaceae bacterium]|nr:hypothetical protein [Oscillospiraceae bacterium]